MIATFTSFLSGKVFTYLLNAYTDAAIGSKVDVYLRTGRIPSGTSEVSSRARAIIRAARGSEEFLRGAIYAMVKVNGLADYVYACVIDRIFLLRVFNRYCKELCVISCGEPSWFPMRIKPLVDSAMRRGIIWVERHNIETNRRMARDIRNGNAKAGEKVRRILLEAKKAPLPHLFAESAARTQIAAANWDRLFIFLLTLR